MKKLISVLAVSAFFLFTVPTQAMVGTASDIQPEYVAKPSDKKPGKKKKKEAQKACNSQQQAKPSCCSGASHCGKSGK